MSHADELGYIFNTKLLPTPSKGSSAEKCVRRIVKLIKNFSSYGNPTPDVNDFGFIWQPLQRDNFYLELGTELIAKRNPESNRMKIWQKLLQLDKRNSNICYLKVHSD